MLVRADPWSAGGWRSGRSADPLYDLGTGNQVKIPSEVMIPEPANLNLPTLALFRSLIIRIRLRLLLLSELCPETGVV